jgi:hypothetical protein
MKNLKRLSLIAVGTLLAVSLVLVLGIWMHSSDAKLQKRNELLVLPVGIARAKSECLKHSLGTEVCSSLTGDASTTECSNGYVCWIVYVKASEPATYRATMFVERVDPKSDTSMKRLRVVSYHAEP